MEPEPAGKFSVGLTGGIGCGKTTVADMFAVLGASLVDTDLIAHALTTAHGPAMPALEAEFGARCVGPDGAMDRAWMRELVFSDPTARARLEAVLHPRIRDASLAAAAAASGAYVIFVVPLLIESGEWRARVTRVLAIDCPEEIQIARVMKRNGMTEAQVRAIMAAQVTREQRLAAADDVVVNAAGIDELRPQVARLHAEYLVFSERMSRLPRQRL